MSACEEVAKRHEFAVLLVLDINDSPAVLTTAHLLASDDDVLFRTHDGERDHVLDLRILRAFLLVKLVVVVWVHLQVVEGKLLLDALLESRALLHRKRVRFGDHGNHIDDVRQLLQDNDVDGLQGMARGLDEKETAVDTGVLDVALALSRELFAKIG